MNAREILEQAVREDVSDIFIVAGLPISCRKNGNIIQTQEEKLFPKETEALLNEIYGMAGDRDMMNLLVHGDDDFFICHTRGFPFSCQCLQTARRSVSRYPCHHIPAAESTGTWHS